MTASGQRQGRFAEITAPETKAAIIDGIYELTQVLAAFADTNDCEVELIVRDEGTLSLMKSEDGGGSFEELARFDTVDELYEYVAGEDDDAN
jgi:hypothetical protein